MKQLSLFSIEELERCTLASNVLKNVRRAIRTSQATTTDFENLLNEDYAEQFGKVIKFPVKRVS